MDVERSDEGNFRQYVVANLGDATESENSEETSHTCETSTKHGAIDMLASVARCV